MTLIAAAIVIPPTAARLLTDSFGKMLILATVIGAATGFCGMFVSYQYDIASGAAIVLLNAAIFAAVYALTALRRVIVFRRQDLETLPVAASSGPHPLPETDVHLFG